MSDQGPGRGDMTGAFTFDHLSFAILRVTDMLPPLDDSAVERLLNRDVSH